MAGWQNCGIARRIERLVRDSSADLFRERNTKAARRIPKDLWRGVQRKLKTIDVAARLDDLESPPGHRLKALQGDLKGHYSLRVNDRYRVAFRWENGHAFEVAAEDYH